jgi:nicotinamidase-related amidase
VAITITCISGDTTTHHDSTQTLYNYIGTRYRKGSMATHILDPDDDETLPMVDTTTGMVNLQQYCYHSARRLEAAGRFQIFIWPEHCCIGSIDHTLVDTVYQALREWANVLDGVSNL